GGQQQRVALARAIVRRPKLFLFDEPLSNVDAKLRAEMRAELSRLHQRLNATMVYVTHDQVEAMTLGTRIVVIHQGKIQQIGTPLEIYKTPSNAFVASFMGSPPMNLLKTDEVKIGFRPHDCTISEDGGLQVQIELVEALGHEKLVHAKVLNGVLGGAKIHPSQTLVASLPSETKLITGEEIQLHVELNALHKFHTESGARLE
ncbi:MAG: ATP-binding cassette domain-containing protein, partial [Planctomycetes bacterium]|nr:ATP-binding cassette domain-containing protein [Planctomycetota bacterium]